MINAGYAGRDYRYTYAATGKPGWFLFDGLVKHDLHTGSEERFAFDDGVYGSETAMAPRTRQHRRGRRLSGHPDHRHERRRVLLPGVRRRPGGRRPGVQTAVAGTDFQRHPLDLGRRIVAAALARRRRRAPPRSGCRWRSPNPMRSPACSGCSATSGRCWCFNRPSWAPPATAISSPACPISHSVLSSRLRSLTDDGLLERRVYQTNPPRSEYLTTPRSRSLWPMLVSIWNWERLWVPRACRTRCPACTTPSAAGTSPRW